MISCSTSSNNCLISGRPYAHKVHSSICTVNRNHCRNNDSELHKLFRPTLKITTINFINRRQRSPAASSQRGILAEWLFCLCWGSFCFDCCSRRKWIGGIVQSFLLLFGHWGYNIFFNRADHFWYTWLDCSNVFTGGKVLSIKTLFIITTQNWINFLILFSLSVPRDDTQQFSIPLPLVKSLGFCQLVASTTRVVGRYKSGIFVRITCNIGRYTCNLEKFKVIAWQSVDVIIKNLCWCLNINSYQAWP